MKVREGIARLVSAETPLDARLSLASGDTPGGVVLTDADRVTLLFLLTYDKDAGVAAAATRSFAGLSESTLLSALGSPLDPLVIKTIVKSRGESEAITSLTLFNPGVDLETVCSIAERGSDFIVTILMDDLDRLARQPSIIEALKKNPLAPVAALDAIRRSIEGRGAPLPAAGAGAGAPSGPHHGKASSTSETEDADDMNTFQRIQGLSVSERIKLAFTGNKEERGILIKESNKMISLAVLRNPRISEEEILSLTAQKSTPDEMLRAIARNKEWVKNYTVKFGLVTNAKTPLKISLKLLESLNTKDMERISKSRNVPGVLASAARRLAERKGRR